MKSIKNLIRITVLAVTLAALGVFLWACGDGTTPAAESYTLTFETNGGTPIEPITALEGSRITPPADPEKSGYEFKGWYRYSDFSGDVVTIPEIMPSRDITYYAKFVLPGEDGYKIIYDINLADVEPTGDVTATQGLTGATATVKDGGDYGVTGYKFLGWSLKKAGPVYLTGGEKAEGQYDAGDSIEYGTRNITLYAQWARAYSDVVEASKDILYVYEPLIGKGLGAAILSRAGQPDKYGFIESSETTQSGYDEFTFYFDDKDGGEVIGRLFPDELKYQFPDGNKGEYLCYDYVIDDYSSYILAMDGFGNATISEVVGQVTAVRMFGYYSYNADYDDFEFISADPDTGLPNIDDNGDLIGLYFATLKEEIADTAFAGYFIIQGGESGSYLLYDNGELLNMRLELNGYGTAVVKSYNSVDDTTEVVATGLYGGTEFYENEFGEWLFTPDDNASGGEFRFILNSVFDGTDNVFVYIEYDENTNKTYTAADGSGDTLYLDGYGSAQYSSNGASYGGSCTVGDGLVTFVPYIEDSNGGLTAGGKLYFNIDNGALTFSVNSTGFVVDGTGTITAYQGESGIVVIPETVSGITVTAIADNAFNCNNSDDAVSLVQVTIPATVTSIGIRAFQNKYTLQRAIFLSPTPVAIDWSATNNPFRWPAGNFIIVVPEGSQDAYKTAWSARPSNIMIKGSVEVTQLPEFDVADGVLVAYNKQPGSADLIDIVLPDEVTEIAANVFRGLDFVRSIDLNNVAKIGSEAFYDNANLESAVFTNVTEIGAAAFGYCTKLGSGSDGRIELPAIVTVGESAFMACEKLKTVVFGTDISEISSKAFTECHVYEDETPLFLEFTVDHDSAPPAMGEKVTIGNISVKIKVPNIDYAIACYAAPSWNMYVKHLYIESGAEKGMYLSGTDSLELDGRAILFDSYTMLYTVNDNVITLYEYDETTGKYATLDGTITADTVTLTLDGKTYTFKRPGATETYTSDDGLYTLVCDPLALLPETYEDTGYVGVAEATLNGVPVEISIRGFNTKTIKSFLDEDGKHYDISLSFDGNTLVYEKTLTPMYIRNVTAADGSVINLHITGTAIYVYGTLKIEVEDGVYLPEFGDYGTMATNTAENVYTFTRSYKNVTYAITVTLSADNTAFTYTYQVQ